MHIYTLVPSLLQSFRKFCWAVSEELRLQTVLSSIFHFGLILSSKSAYFRERKNWIKISCGCAHLHIKSFITTKFQEFLLSSFRGVSLTNCWSGIFHFGQKFLVQKGHNSEKKNGIKISCGYAHLHNMFFKTTKFYDILLCGFRGVALTRKTGLPDWLTDWLMYGSKTLYPP